MTTEFPSTNTPVQPFAQPLPLPPLQTPAAEGDDVPAKPAVVGVARPSMVGDYARFGGNTGRSSLSLSEAAPGQPESKADESVSEPAVTPVEAAAPAPTAATYRVQPGDTLSGIAQKVLNDGGQWQAIFDANRDQLSNPDLIVAGQELKIPGAAPGSLATQPAAAPSDPTAMPPGFPFSPEDVAQRLGLPLDKVQQNLPGIAQALSDAGITDRNAVIGALATIQTEVPNFEPIPEYASGADYEGRADLGNTQPGDGVRYKGRGYIQLTGRANYQQYGEKLGVDLVGNPDLALDPAIGAKVLVQYFQDRGLFDKAQAGDWQGVRVGVNGGTNGWDTFSGAVQALA